ncbi:MAG: DUF4372 domain-containing protein [Pirellulales bacterium]|nr:DUF4372 domain-containing protein [Pirellulales bacterium]
MCSQQFVFAQMMDFLPRREFNACVQRYRGDRRWRSFSCRDHFLCLSFAQLTFRESLRDIETCLRALGPKLYHAGFRGNVSRSTLTNVNRAYDWRIANHEFLWIEYIMSDFLHPVPIFRCSTKE